FNGRISELCQQTRFRSSAELEQTLMNYLQAYNHFIPQRAIGYQSPIDALKSWYAQHPDLFVKQVYKQAELDTSSGASST
ncbi:MAG: integrase core domain-containing protein, partial [Zoogloeaceae bacterium]|nr:integrase core domain-containing protein [Zoogloeaceae bacterium]